MSSSVMFSGSVINISQKDEVAQRRTVSALNEVQSEAILAASVTLHPQAVIALDISKMANAF